MVRLLNAVKRVHQLLPEDYHPTNISVFICLFRESKKEIVYEILDTLYNENVDFEPGERLEFSSPIDNKLVKGNFISHDGDLILIECIWDEGQPENVGKKQTYHKTWMKR